MDQPFAKSTPISEKYRRLLEVVETKDSVAIVVNADPDALASAVALKRLLWRRVKFIGIYRINKIDRADNMAFIKLLNIRQQHLRQAKKSTITKWALVDSQPNHNEAFSSIPFDIIIDHHPISGELKAAFIDIKEEYGATSTIMGEYLKAAKIKVSPRLATALFYGIKADTDNFVRGVCSADIAAFHNLYDFTNMNIIKKIESSEMTIKSLAQIGDAIERLTIIKQIAFVHMGRVKNTDILVIIADFFMKLAEATGAFVRANMTES